MRDEDYLGLYPLISQIVDDRLRARLDAMLSARGVNLGSVDGAAEGELWAAGSLRTANGIVMGDTSLASSSGILTASLTTASPSAPADGSRLLYAKADGWYQQGPDGLESKI